MKTKGVMGAMALVSVLLLVGATVWEGVSDVSPSRDSAGNYSVATNAFPRDTVVDITNLENGKMVRVRVTAVLESGGLLATLSQNSAESIDLRANATCRIRMTKPQDSIAFAHFKLGPIEPPAEPVAQTTADEEYDEEYVVVVMDYDPSGDFESAREYVVVTDYTPSGESDPAEEYTFVAEYTPVAKDTSVAEYTPGDEYEPAEAYASVAEYAPAVAPDSAEEYAYIAEYTPGDEYDPAEEYASVAEYAPAGAPDSAEEYASVAEYAPGYEYDPAAEYTSVAEYTPMSESDSAPGYAAYEPMAGSGALSLVPTDERIPPAENSLVIAPEDRAPPIQSAQSASAAAHSSSDFSPFPVPLISQLEQGKSYVQVGVYTRSDNVEDEISRIGMAYPLAVQNVGTDIKPLFRVLLGPLNQGESYAMLQRFKSIGYDDAFVRHN